MLTLQQTKTFKKCLKKYQHKSTILEELKKIIELLINERSLPAKYRDHELKGQYQGCRELHLKPDILLIYITIQNKTITLLALGSHSELF